MKLNILMRREERYVFLNLEIEQWDRIKRKDGHLEWDIKSSIQFCIYYSLRPAIGVIFSYGTGFKKCKEK